MSVRALSRAGAAALGALPAAAHAQYVHPLVAAAALSPVLVLLLCAILGWVARSARTAVRHAGFVMTWVVLFLLASYFVENDYVIWTPLALYVLHSALLLVLIVVHAVRRVAGGDRTA